MMGWSLVGNPSVAVTSMTSAPASVADSSVFMLPAEWEIVVGLEVHVELNTVTKLFCGCLNMFGSEPNTNVCPVCLGLPGSLPVANRVAIDYAMRLGRALGCQVGMSVFARKNYFYPDMPKNYQISQYDQPTNVNGVLALPDGSSVGIERVHIEEDTGKITHVGSSGRIHGAMYSLVDYNRAGVPLVEIVSRPQIHSISQAKACVREIRAILLAVGVSDARMEEGSMRVDANVSVRPAGSCELRTRCEIKNLSSLRSLGRALFYEASRHIELWESGDAPTQATRHWDEQKGKTVEGRSKEDADDYRYFPDPDLEPLQPPKNQIASIDSDLPVLPEARRQALVQAGHSTLSTSDAALLVERGQDSLVMEAIAYGANPEMTVARVVNQLAVDDWANITSKRLAKLITMGAEGKLSLTHVKKVLVEMLKTDAEPEDIMQSQGLYLVDADSTAATVKQVIDSHPKEWERFCTGDDVERKKMTGFLTGQVMRISKGRADGAAVNRLLQAHAHACGL